MTPFESIILAALYTFAFAYAAQDFGLRKYDILIVKILIVIMAATIGVLCFPTIIAGDIWNKLNEEEQQ